ncbi:MAG: hypothetical protein AAGA56_26500 [Myxococcota bacterium]
MMMDDPNATSPALRCLEEALAMTASVLRGPASLSSVRALLDARTPLLDQAQILKGEGTWSSAEKRVVDQVLAADRALVQKMWSPRREQFEWVKKRSPEIVADFPQLAAMNHK